MNKNIVLIQARISSQRFPGKVLKPFVAEISLLEYVFKRCRQSKNADLVAVVTSNDTSDDLIWRVCVNSGMPVFRGSLDDVLERFVHAAGYYDAKYICRVCADSPFVDVKLIDLMFDYIEKKTLDYIVPDTENCMPGFMSEIVTFEALKKISGLQLTNEEKEHVTLHIRNNPGNFKIEFLPINLFSRHAPTVQLTIDYPADMRLCSMIADSLPDRFNFTSEDVMHELTYNRGKYACSGFSEKN